MGCLCLLGYSRDLYFLSYVFTFLVPCCDVCYDYRIENDVQFVFAPSCLLECNDLFMCLCLFSYLLRSPEFTPGNIVLCCAVLFCFVCLQLVSCVLNVACVLCAQCCLCLVCSMLPVSCVLNVACVSGLSILACPFGFL